MSLRSKLSYQCNIPDSAFTRVDGKEFCGECQTTIVDFTVMSDQEIRDYIATLSLGVCVKIDSDQLNRVKVQHSGLRRKVVIAATATLLAVTTESSAQTNTMTTEQVEQDSVIDLDPGQAVVSDTNRISVPNDTLEGQPLHVRKQLKRWVFLKMGRRHYYVMNRFPFFGWRYVGLRGKF